MKRVMKRILGVLIIAVVVLALSPLISLVFPEKLTRHTYYRLVYNLIADQETKGASSDESKARRLFQYVIDHEFVRGEPFKAKPFESLIYAQGYCDFQARTLNSLLASAGIKSRYAMLLDKDGISPHTLNEVFLEGRWCAFDTLMNIIFEDGEGNKLSLEQLSDHPDLILGQTKLAALKDYDRGQFERFKNWYSRMFPMPALPRRSNPLLLQSHIFDRISDAYSRIFKRRFFDFYQDLYLRFKKKYPREDFRFFFKARNYHLAYRYDLALSSYNSLIERFPESEYAGDAHFFLGVLYFDTGLLSKSAVFFRDLIKKYPQEWGSSGYYYLAKVYAAMGKKKESLKAYSNADIYELSAQTIGQLTNKGD
ncbi:transglutaminase domain-containing protein [Candidatus Omnitrophota bacterium]